MRVLLVDHGLQPPRALVGPVAAGPEVHTGRLALTAPVEPCLGHDDQAVVECGMVKRLCGTQVGQGAGEVRQQFRHGAAAQAAAAGGEQQPRVGQAFPQQPYGLGDTLAYGISFGKLGVHPVDGVADHGEQLPEKETLVALPAAAADAVHPQPGVRVAGQPRLARGIGEHGAHGCRGHPHIDVLGGDGERRLRHGGAYALLPAPGFGDPLGERQLPALLPQPPGVRGQHVGQQIEALGHPQAPQLPLTGLGFGLLEPHHLARLGIEAPVPVLHTGHSGEQQRGTGPAQPGPLGEHRGRHAVPGRGPLLSYEVHQAPQPVRCVPTGCRHRLGGRDPTGCWRLRGAGAQLDETLPVPAGADPVQSDHRTVVGPSGMRVLVGEFEDARTHPGANLRVGKGSFCPYVQHRQLDRAQMVLHVEGARPQGHGAAPADEPVPVPTPVPRGRLLAAPSQVAADLGERGERAGHPVSGTFDETVEGLGDPLLVEGLCGAYRGVGHAAILPDHVLPPFAGTRRPCGPRTARGLDRQ
ncbi:hypothetical protein ACQEU8_00170 [Streptomyces sp. CA-250714]|uniref:hypothetical protein n=1 Tax=Streptomyces sp. CA-250714 TaxID=3240060 RepID=UPI003D8EA11B